MAENQSGTRIYAQAAGRSTLAVLAAALNDVTARSTLRIRTGDREIPVEPKAWQDTHTQHGTLSLLKLDIADLEPATSYTLQLVSGTRVLAEATGTTLPAPDATRFGLMVGSCYAAESDWSYVLAPAYERVAAEIAAPTYNVWLGDQVYLDAPWQKGWTIANTHRVIYGKYHRSWGLTDEDSGLAEVMAQSSNWYLPDDHEFWNGYPAPSVLTLPIHTLRRVVLQAWRARPKGPVPHPFAQGKFGRVAGEAFCQFQSAARYDSFGEHVSPPQVQLIETAGATIVMADTRWHRTIKKSGDQAGFMLPEDFDQVIEVLDTHEHLVGLMLSKPLIGHLPHRGVTRGKVEYGPEDYTFQYERLWRAITRRAERGVPTLTIGGDVHRHAVRTAIDGGLIEVVSSPCSLLDALDERSLITRLRKLWKSLKTRARSFEARHRDDTTVVASDGKDDRLNFPDFRSDNEWELALGSSEFIGTEDRSGIAGLEIDTSDPNRPVIEFHSAIDSRSRPSSADATRIPVMSIGFGWDGARWERTAVGDATPPEPAVDLRESSPRQV